MFPEPVLHSRGEEKRSLLSRLVYLKLGESFYSVSRGQVTP